MVPTLLIPLILLLLIQQITIVQSSYIIEINHGERECFILKTPSNMAGMIMGDYEWINYGEMEDIEDDEYEYNPDDIQIWLEAEHHKSEGEEEETDSETETVWSSSNEHTEEFFEYHTTNGGRHYLCIENNSNLNKQQVGFAMRYEKPIRSLDEKEIGADEEHALQLAENSLQLENYWEILSDHYDYLRDREIIHRNLIEKTFERIISWTICEAFVLILVSTFQVLYLKKFFEKRQYL